MKKLSSNSQNLEGLESGITSYCYFQAIPADLTSCVWSAAESGLSSIQRSSDFKMEKH